MITVANRIYVKPGYAEAFEARFRERAGLVDEMPGFVSNRVLRPVNEGDPYVVFTVWRSRQDFINWVRSDASTKGHSHSGLRYVRSRMAVRSSPMESKEIPI